MTGSFQSCPPLRLLPLLKFPIPCSAFFGEIERQKECVKKKSLQENPDCVICIICCRFKKQLKTRNRGKCTATFDNGFCYDTRMNKQKTLYIYSKLRSQSVINNPLLILSGRSGAINMSSHLKNLLTPCQRVTDERTRVRERYEGGGTEAKAWNSAVLTCGT